MTHPKPFGELSRAEKGELLLAHHEGRRIEIFTSTYEWFTPCEFDLWKEDRLYRIAPKPLTPDTIDWSHVHPDYKFMARDIRNNDRGCAELFRKRPSIDVGSGNWFVDGMPSGLGLSAGVFTSYQRGTVDWKDSLVVRPGYEGDRGCS
jgi:hypothetical protein